MGSTAFLAEPIERPGESMGGPAGAGVGLQCMRLRLTVRNTALPMCASVQDLQATLQAAIL